jgi:uncharacterized protein
MEIVHARENPRQERAFLTAEWRYLAMLNYEVDPKVLSPYVPTGTELDSWGGKTYVSMVAFMFLKTKVRGMRIPFHQNFEEINLRFYVQGKGPEGWRRGVVFIKEIVPRFAIAAVARLFYNENYVALPTRHRLDVATTNSVAEYAWRFRGAWNRIFLKTMGEPELVKAGSLEEFITEHYWGYAAQKSGGCVEYQVGHPKWRVWQAEQASLECDVKGLYGEEFAPFLDTTPSSAFLAEGSEVTVYSGRRI